MSASRLIEWTLRLDLSYNFVGLEVEAWRVPNHRISSEDILDANLPVP